MIKSMRGWKLEAQWPEKNTVARGVNIITCLHVLIEKGMRREKSVVSVK